MTFSRSKSGSGLTRTPRQAWVLEPRMMFDAAAVTTAADVAAHVAATETAPGVDATPVKATVTITDTSDSFAAVDLFSNVSVSASNDGQELKDLTITVNRTGANQALVIDNTSITLEAFTGAKTTTGTGQYSYGVTVSGETTTITLSIASSEAFAPTDVARLIDGIAYKPLDNTVAGGDVSVTLKSLSDDGDTADLNIHSTVTIDSRINVAPVVTGDVLLEAESLAHGTDVAYSADGKQAYVAGADNTLTVFSVGTSGQLTQKQILSVENLGNVNDLVVSADGKSLYTLSGNGNLMQFSLEDGNLRYTATLSVGSGASGGLAIADDGSQVYADATGGYGRDVLVYQRNAETGELTRSESLRHRNSLITTVGDYVYIVHSGLNSTDNHGLTVYQRGSDGKLNSLGSILFAIKGQDLVNYSLAVSADKQSVYVANPNTNDISLYRIGANNELTLVNSFASNPVSSMVMNAQGTQLYVATTDGRVSIYAVSTTGVLTQTGQVAGSTSGTDITLSPDGRSLLVAGDGVSRYSTLLTQVRGTGVAIGAGLTLSDANFDALNAGNGNYGTLAVIVSRDGGASLKDVFSFNAANNLRLENGQVFQGERAIATFSQNAGTLTLTFLAGVNRAEANAVLHQVTYQNTDTVADGSIVTLSLRANDGRADSLPVALAVMMASNTAPQLVTSAITVPTYDTTSTSVKLFTNTQMSAGEAGQKILDITLNIGGLEQAANEFLVIDGTRINLTQSGSGETSSGYSYTYTLSDGSGTLTIHHATGMTVAAAQTLINDVTYLNDTVKATTGTRTVTLVSVRDDGGATGQNVDTATLNVTTTLTLAINNAPTIETDIAVNPNLYYSNGLLTGYSTHVSSMVLSDDGRTLLVIGTTSPNYGGDARVSLYQRDPATGALTLLQQLVPGTDDGNAENGTEVSGLVGRAAVFSADGSTVYLSADSTVLVFSKDADTGILSLTARVEGLSGSVLNMVRSDDGKSLYALTSGTLYHYTIGANGALGSATTFNQVDGTTPIGLSIDAKGTVYVMGNSGKITIYTTAAGGALSYAGQLARGDDGVTLTYTDSSGAQKAAGTLESNNELNHANSAFTVTDEGYIYVVTSNVGNRLTVLHYDSETNAVNRVEALKFTNPWGVTATSDGKTLYVGSNNGVVTVYAIASDGKLTQTGTITVGRPVTTLTVSDDGQSLYTGARFFNTGVIVSSALAHSSYFAGTISTPFMQGIQFSDVDMDELNSYQGMTFTISRSGSASADDVFSLLNVRGLSLQGSELLLNNAKIADVTIAEGTIAISITSPISKAVANQILQQVTYRNGATESPERVDLQISVRDSGGKSVDLTLALVLTNPPAEPTLITAGQQATVNVGAGSLPAAIDLFGDVYIALGKDNAALSELTLTVSRAGANEALVIDGTSIPLTATTSAGTTTHGHQYQVSVENGIATLRLSLHDGDNGATVVSTLIDGIHYQTVNDAVSEGAVTVTLTRLADANDNVALLDISAVVTVQDSRLIPHLGADAGSLDYVELFDLLDDNGNSRLIGIQGITVIGDNIYAVRAHSESVYNEATGVSDDVKYNTLYMLQRGEDGKLHLSNSVEITGVTDTTQIRASSDGSSLYVIGANGIALFNASDLSAIGTFGSDIGMVRDVLVNGNSVYVTTGDSLLVFKREGSTFTLSNTFTDAGDSGLQLDAANALTLSPDGKTLFVATSGGETVVSRFSVADDGVLTFRQSVAGTSASEDGYYASALDVSPDGKTLYVVDNNKLLHIFSVAEDGTLTASSTLTIGEQVTLVKQVLVSPDGKNVVVIGDLGKSDLSNTYGVILYSRAADGSLTPLQSVEGFGDLANYNGTALNEIRQAAFSEDGKQLYLTGTINYGTPEGVIVLDLQPANVTFTEEGSAVALLPGGTLSALANNQSSYQGATLVIERTGGTQASDQFGFLQDSGLSVKDNQIWQGDKAIANVATSTTGTLTLTFLAGVNQSEAQQVLRAISYSTTNNAPTLAGDHAAFQITFNDGKGRTATFTAEVALIDINDAAIVSTEPVSSSYASGGDAVHLFKNTTIDTVEVGQQIHRLEVHVSPVSAGDVLHVDGGTIALDQTIDYQVFVGESKIEYRVSVTEGVATVTLYVMRDGAGTAQLIDSLTYSHSGTDGSGSRSIGLKIFEEVDWLSAQPHNDEVAFSGEARVTFNAPENSAPVYNDNAGLNLGQLQASTAYHYTLPENLFTDADRDSLTWRVSGLPAGLSFDAATRTISGTPTAAGEFTMVLTANDGKAEATHSVQVTVDPAAPENSAPVYNDNAGLNLGQPQAGTAYHYALPDNLFTDADNESLTWRVSGLPGGLRFDAATRTISGTPTAAGEFTVVLTANDGKAEATHSVKVTVAQAPAPGPSDNRPAFAPMIPMWHGMGRPVDMGEREREQPLGAIVVDLSRPEAPPQPLSQPINPVVEPVRQRDADMARQSNAPWVLTPLMSPLLPTLESVDFSSRPDAAIRDNASVRSADSNLFLSVRGQAMALESAFSSVQGALQPDASGALVFSLPQRMFSVREGNATLTLQLANGRPLPSWVQFDARSGVVRITDASAVQVNQIQLALKAQAADGSSRIVPITLQTGQGGGAEMATDRGAMQRPSLPVENRNVEPLSPAGKTAFTEQLRQHQPEQDDLLAALSELSSQRA
ncbi:beta-propeller fold lactonase family protein [Pectobacterium fontis]|uniref:Dystroglycan-type cadherin-like domain-containing protein n=1 Tax=Pectobacterium fontis TaxID=2558042 RepID=A0A7V8L733_9GAMM|nr:beta-propeller fold lactonase family protein [Pectobacterium fontis]KHN53736.1 hypothetical protein OI69_05755 [Pectobacterium fontis]